MVCCIYVCMCVCVPACPASPFTTPSFLSPPRPLQVFQKLQEAEVTAQEIEKLREGYRPAARRGALLFFVLAEMAAVNFMYQYSLNAYLGVFDYSLRKSLPDSHLAKRLKNIIDTLTYNVYVYACTGEPWCGVCIVFLLLCDGCCEAYGTYCAVCTFTVRGVEWVGA